MAPAPGSVTPAAARPSPPWFLRELPRLGALLLFVGVTLGLVAFHGRLGDIQSYKGYGYPGAFLVSLISSGGLFLPLPAIAVQFALGHALNPLLVGVLAGAGEAVGELTGYAAGYGGSVFLSRHRFYPRLRDIVQRRGALAVFVVSTVPNPIFDLIGAIAGAGGMAVWKFLFVCWGGKTIKTTATALAGYWGLEGLLRLAERLLGGGAL